MTVDDWLERVSAGLNAIATAWIGAIMVVAVADVFVRDISTVIGRAFNLDVSGIQIHGTHEIVRWSIVAIVFLQLPDCLRKGKHIRSDYLIGLLPPRGRAGADLVAHGLGVLVFAIIVYGSWANMIHAWVIGEFEGEGAIRFPVYPMRTILIVGSAVLALEFLARAARDLRRLLGVDRAEPEAIVLPTGR